MSKLTRTVLAAPIAAIILSESGWTFAFEMSSFHGLFRGKIWSAPRIVSASAVLKRIGCRTLGIDGRWLVASSRGGPVNSPRTNVNGFFVFAATGTGEVEQSRTMQADPRYDDVVS